MKSLARLLALLAAGACALACAKLHHAFPNEEALRGCARDLDLAGRSASRLHVYLDSSASMRGFALAATANSSAAPEGFSTVLLGVDSLSELAGRGALRSGAPLIASRFDLGTASLPAGISLVQVGLGALAAEAPEEPAPHPGHVAHWRSSDCPARPSSHWGGSPVVRSRIDRFFDGAHTCLSRVFDEISAGAAGTAFAVVTDAEQNAPDDSPQCHSARSQLGIQTRLDEWVRGRGNYAAVVAYQLDSFPWRAAAVGESFCGPARRTLYVYLLTPDAETAEAIFGQLAGTWRGEAGRLAYFPLAQRPAAQFTVEMKPLRGASGATALVRAEAAELAEPEPGTLPVLSLEQKGDAARVRFTVRSALFESPDVRARSDLGAPGKTQRRFSWREQPLRVAFPPPGKGQQAKSWKLGEEGGGLSLLQPAAGAEPPDALGAFQLGHFHAGPKQEADDAGMAGTIPPLIIELRRRPGQAHGCELFLIELESAAGLPAAAAAGAGADLPLLQARFLTRRSPVLRFLLHVDY
jgi:hypothetical protein